MNDDDYDLMNALYVGAIEEELMKARGEALMW